jgi:hypothetical protein
MSHSARSHASGAEVPVSTRHLPSWSPRDSRHMERPCAFPFCLMQTGAAHSVRSSLRGERFLSHRRRPKAPVVTPGPRSAPRRNAANSERSGLRRPTGRSVPARGHGDQTFALGQFPGGLARASDGFCLLAGLALRRFFIRLAALHLTKNALALHLLFEDPESLIDIVVANDDLQMFSNRAAGAVMRRHDVDEAVAVNAF